MIEDKESVIMFIVIMLGVVAIAALTIHSEIKMKELEMQVQNNVVAVGEI